MQMVEELTDADIAEVNQSKATFGGVEEATEPLYRFLNLVHGERWLIRHVTEPRAARSPHCTSVYRPSCTACCRFG